MRRKQRRFEQLLIVVRACDTFRVLAVAFMSSPRAVGLSAFSLQYITSVSPAYMSDLRDETSSTTLRYLNCIYSMRDSYQNSCCFKILK